MVSCFTEGDFLVKAEGKWFHPGGEKHPLLDSNTSSSFFGLGLIYQTYSETCLFFFFFKSYKENDLCGIPMK